MNTFAPTLRPKLAPHVRAKIDPQSGDPVLLFPEGLLILNSTAHEIVQRCTGEISVGELVRQLAEEFEVEQEVLRADVYENLEQLREKNLLLFLV